RRVLNGHEEVVRARAGRTSLRSVARRPVGPPSIPILGRRAMDRPRGDDGQGTTDSGAVPSLSARRRYLAGVIDWTLLAAAVYVLYEAPAIRANRPRPSRR